MPDIRTIGITITETLEPYNEQIHQFTRTAGENISALRVVRDSGAGSVVLARWPEPESKAPLGITTTAAISGGEIFVRSFGEMSDPAWSWTVSTPVLLGANGVLYQGAPQGPWFVIVGMATRATSLVVRIQPPVTLA